MRAYQRFEVDEPIPVQYVGVYVTRWQPEWGEPTAAFGEMEAHELMDVPEVRALVEALRKAEWVSGERYYSICPICKGAEAHYPDCPISSALAPFEEAPDAD